MAPADPARRWAVPEAGQPPRGAASGATARAPVPPDLSAYRVVHLVGALSDSVYRLLGPATDALAQAGARQVMVVTEDPRHASLVNAFDPSVHRVVLRSSRNLAAHWRRWLRAARHVLAEEKADVVHLHGLIPSVLARPLIRRFAPRRWMFSPHDSRAQQSGRLAHRPAGFFLRPLMRLGMGGAVVGMPSEARLLQSVSGLPLIRVETPVHPAYLDARRDPAPHPLVAGGVFDEPATTAAGFVQLAVLMAAGENGLRFEWLGAAWGEAGEQLHAAGIGIVDERDPFVRSARLATAWVFVCPSATRGLPGHLVEAMACGLPVVALDTPMHRDLIRDGETGLLCADDAALVDGVARLIGDEALRCRLGDAARAQALRRFGDARFDGLLVRAYAADGGGRSRLGAR
jgi:peptidoglycan/xylan/chitin deacetylase (PgdA/CDA1 family)